MPYPDPMPQDPRLARPEEPPPSPENARLDGSRSPAGELARCMKIAPGARAQRRAAGHRREGHRAPMRSEPGRPRFSPDAPGSVPRGGRSPGGALPAPGLVCSGSALASTARRHSSPPQLLAPSSPCDRSLHRHLGGRPARRRPAPSSAAQFWFCSSESTPARVSSLPVPPSPVTPFTVRLPPACSVALDRYCELPVKR